MCVEPISVHTVHSRSDVSTPRIERLDSLLLDLYSKLPFFCIHLLHVIYLVIWRLQWKIHLCPKIQLLISPFIFFCSAIPK